MDGSEEHYPVFSNLLYFYLAALLNNEDLGYFVLLDHHDD